LPSHGRVEEVADIQVNKFAPIRIGHGSLLAPGAQGYCHNLSIPVNLSDKVIAKRLGNITLKFKKASKPLGKSGSEFGEVIQCTLEL
jgi:hypothetical protein